MKNKLFLRLLGTAIFSSLFTIKSTAQIGIYYTLPDYCGRYNQGCTEVVDKCREWGNDYCAVYEQKPCSEVCGPTPIGIS